MRQPWITFLLSLYDQASFCLFPLDWQIVFLLLYVFHFLNS